MFSKNTCLISALIFFISTAVPLSAQDYILNGDAVDLGGECFQLTPDSTFKTGAVWYQEKISLEHNFTIRFKANFGDKDSLGGGGIAFVLQPVCKGLGAGESGLGYGGINPAVALEFDTYQDPANNDPAQDHLGMSKAGISSHNDPSGSLGGGFALFNFETGADFLINITYNATTKYLQLYINGFNYFSHQGDLTTYLLNGITEVYWGFTAATGATSNRQTVCIDYTNFEPITPYTVTAPGTPGSSDGGIDLDLSGGYGPFTYMWSNGATTEDLTGIAAGTYTVTVTDTNHCASKYTITVVSDPDLTPPTIVCPENIIVDSDAGLCGATVAYAMPTVTDNAPDPTLALEAGLGSGAIFPVGVSIEYYKARDGSNNTATCSFTITVEDKQAPSMNCPQASYGSCGLPVTPDISGTPAVSDNCDPLPELVYTDSLIYGNCAWECVTERTWKATDLFGNRQSCKQYITRTVQPMIDEALSMGPIILGAWSHTLTIDQDAAACLGIWMPAQPGPAAAIPRRGHHTVNLEDCLPGPVPVNSAGKLTNPLLEQTLLLAIELRLNPGLGQTLLSEFECDLNPVIFQYMGKNPTLTDLLRLANNALGNIIGPPHLELIREALACVNGATGLCEPPASKPVQNLGVPLLANEPSPTLELYPNPADGLFYLPVQAGRGEVIQLAVWSAQGRLVRRWEIADVSEGAIAVDLTGEPAGVYCISVVAGNRPLRTANIVLTGR
ncbi:MAG TPA: HYR domain-containing protein, partial [Flavilitoribacter sp.]|nr:HYR domain-containing protein [Flavilitoribacter sp.]HMQ89244.1 HYR domain-containing protein [Flavilitoribacter sp.]